MIDDGAIAVEPEPAPRPRISRGLRAVNWLRLNICNWLGITYAIRKLVEADQNTAQSMVKVAEQTAHNTRLIASMLRKHEAWEQEVAAISKASQRLADDEKNGLMVLRNHRNGS